MNQPDNFPMSAAQTARVVDELATVDKPASHAGASDCMQSLGDRVGERVDFACHEA